VVAGHFRAVWCGVDVVVAWDLLYGCLADLVPEADEFPVDASVSPRRVLGGQAHDQSAKPDGRWWSTGTPTWRMGPMPGNASAVPAQQRVGGDDPAVAEPAGERGCDRPEQGPIVIVGSWPVDLAAEYLKLVA